MEFVKFDKSLFCSSEHILEILARKADEVVFPRTIICHEIEITIAWGYYDYPCVDFTKRHTINSKEWFDVYTHVITATICEDVNWFDFDSNNPFPIIPPSGGTGGGSIPVMDLEYSIRYHAIQMQFNPHYVHLMNNYRDCGKNYTTATQDVINNLILDILKNRPSRNNNNLNDQQICDILNAGMIKDPGFYNFNLYETLLKAFDVLGTNGVHTSFTGALDYIADFASIHNESFEILCNFENLSDGDESFLNFKEEVRNDIMNFLTNCETGSEDLNSFLIDEMIAYGKTFAISNYIAIDLCNEPVLDFLKNRLDLSLTTRKDLTNKFFNIIGKYPHLKESLSGCIDNGSFENCISKYYNWFLEDIDGGQEYTNGNPFDWSKHSPVTSRDLPSLAAFKSSYPQVSPGVLLTGASNIFDLLDGPIKDVFTANPNIQNVCALKVSIALNGAGVEIPHIWSDNNGNGIQEPNERNFTIPDNDGNYYFLNANLLINYMLEVFPSPTVIVTSEDLSDLSTPQLAFGTDEGIYGLLPTDEEAFGASGHCDIWRFDPNNSIYECGAGCYWGWLEYAYFWKLN